uniref:Uncharacterized protein n=1 Tax=Avena sativa TaxID=4498 RepID=A0ACD5UN34_AVESA
MCDIVLRDFEELALDGSNYLEWTVDAKILLAAKSLRETIAPISECTDAQKAQATAYLRHHLDRDLKNFVTEEDPLVMWQFLKDRFYGPMQRNKITSDAKDTWRNLRFSDFEDVDEYNSTLHRAASRMKLCGEEITENDMIEKTLSTTHPRNLWCHQGYRVPSMLSTVICFRC